MCFGSLAIKLLGDTRNDLALGFDLTINLDGVAVVVNRRRATRTGTHHETYWDGCLLRQGHANIGSPPEHIGCGVCFEQNLVLLLFTNTLQEVGMEFSCISFCSSM
jgi:hypothetical protein